MKFWKQLFGGASKSISIAAVTPQPGTTNINLIDGAEMVWIPEGEFQMGSGNRDSEMPQRCVCLDGYQLYKTPVTVAQFRIFCKATGRPMPIAPEWGFKEDHPIVNVSWDDASCYAKWAGGHLPSEAEWEKGARGTDGRVFPWGNDWDSSKCGCSKEKEMDAGSTFPVGSYPSGASPYGCLDMAGNVAEWCADWYDSNYYKIATLRNPKGPTSGSARVIRGHAGWTDNAAGYFRCAIRMNDRPDRRNNFCGFRCAL